MDLRRVREEYESRGLDENDLESDPIKQFKIWYSEIENVGYLEPNAMVLSTSDQNGNIESRVVLLKEFNSRGFIFYTNYLHRLYYRIFNNINL